MPHAYFFLAQANAQHSPVRSLPARDSLGFAVKKSSVNRASARSCGRWLTATDGFVTMLGAKYSCSRLLAGESMKRRLAGRK
jgi:hypothetical protein